jgi:uncharacterized protein YecT (DUF1311 family)
VDEKKRFVCERAPAASAGEAKAADAELNAAYQSLMKNTDEQEWRTRLRKAQRAWIAYRDAFAAFYADRWSGTASAGALRREIVTELTRERTTRLAQ